MKILTFGSIAILFAIASLATTHPGKVYADEFSNGASKFIVILAAIAEKSLMGNDISVLQHQEQFRKLIREDFDLRGVGKWVVGRYWRKITQLERAEYLKLFEDFIVATYSKRFRAYKNAKLRVKTTTRRKNSAFVNSEIYRGSSKPIKVTWRVKLSKGEFKIADIIIEGVSWIQTQRSEFVSVIRNNDGKVSSLMNALRKKIKYLKSSKS